MSGGDEGLAPIHEDEGEADQATLDAAAAPANTQAEAEGDAAVEASADATYEDEDFYEDDGAYGAMETAEPTGGMSPPTGNEGSGSPQPGGSEEDQYLGMSEKERDVKELMDLQRKYRMMMGDRQAFQKHAQTKLRQQSSHLNRLQTENETMKKELGAHAPRGGTHGKLHSQTSKLNQLSDEEDKLHKLIHEQSKRSEKLDKHQNFLSRKMNSAREVTGPANARDNQAFIMKQVRVLENRLDKALIKYNEALSRNKSLRGNIDDLRREKNVYDGIYKKLERDLNDKKRVMADIIEMSNQSYEARDQSEHEIELIKRQMREREELWEAELKQLNQKLASFERVQRLMAEDYRGGMDMEEETALKKKVNAGGWKLAAAKGQVADKKDQNESYEEMFLRIRQVTKITDIDVVVDTFIEAEDRNFSLFNYVNELTMEVEKLEEAIGEHQAELEKELDDDSNMNTRSKKIIKGLEDKLVKTEAKAEHYEAKLRQITEEMDVTYNVVESLFSRLGCEQLANTEILGSGGVGESNIMLYLGVIEQRTNDVMNNFMLSGSDVQPNFGSAEVAQQPPADEYQEEVQYEDDAEPEPAAEPAGTDAVEQEAAAEADSEETAPNEAGESEQAQEASAAVGEDEEEEDAYDESGNFEDEEPDENAA